MSTLAVDLFELLRLARCGGGALVSHLLHEVAEAIISEGCDETPISN